MLDLNNLTNLASEAEKIATNPMAQQVMNIPILAGVVDQVEILTGHDMNGNGVVGSSVVDDIDDEDDEDDIPDTVDDDQIDNVVEDTDEENIYEPTTITEDEVLINDEQDDNSEHNSEPMIDA
jgi:hypothetical protein